MLGVRFPLFTKIMVWFFLNLLILAAIFLIFFGINVRFDPNSMISGAGNRLEYAARLIISEADERSREERDDILKKYGVLYGVEFFLFDSHGAQLAGREIELPPSIFNEISRPEGFSRPSREAANDRVPRALPAPAPQMAVSMSTADPTQYWRIYRALTFNAGVESPIRSRLIVRSDSWSGNGLFFDLRPWLALGVVFVVSVLFWLPLVRRMTTSLQRMTQAAERIADEDFSIRVDSHRSDELGSLGSSIDHLARRLDGFVTGQRRFLGDVSHELNSPLARMQFALSILEERVDDSGKVYVNDVKEEVEEMSKLVAELLAYSKSGIKGGTIALEPVDLATVVHTVVERENTVENRNIEVSLEPDLVVAGRLELVTRALSNVVRNAIKYSAPESPISVSAHRNGRGVLLTVSDTGPGVPTESLEKIFDPLFRVNSDRSRESGGSGLGLAIVKTCVEACGGQVRAKNLDPSGLQVEIQLNRLADDHSFGTKSSVEIESDTKTVLGS